MPRTGAGKNFCVEESFNLRFVLEEKIEVTKLWQPVPTFIAVALVRGTRNKIKLFKIVYNLVALVRGIRNKTKLFKII